MIFFNKDSPEKKEVVVVAMHEVQMPDFATSLPVFVPQQKLNDQLLPVVDSSYSLEDLYMLI